MNAINSRPFNSLQSIDRILFGLGELASERMKVGGGFPFHDIIANDDESFKIVFALAGYSEDELEVHIEGTKLTLSANKVTDETDTKYIRRGISKSSFTRSLELPLYSVISGAELKNGLLTIDIKIEVPEERKPRKIQIVSDTKSATPVQGDVAE